MTKPLAHPQPNPLFERGATMVLNATRCSLVKVDGKKIHVPKRCKRCIRMGWAK